ncbi:MAG: hypothetical protein J1G05_03400 [Clostridiales bacterium]|nr:hypothetical protein [Clostridiales bacterium]
MIFYNKDGKLNQIKHKDFSLEKDLQNLVERNLFSLFHLEFLASEFKIDRFRFDSVAFDPETSSFIIIEYKRGKNESLVDQGYAYLHTVLDRRAELVLLYNEVNSASKLSKDFDWTATRIYFISPQFTEYQKTATGYQKMPFKLFEINSYHNNLITVDEINENKIKEEPTIIACNKDSVDSVKREIIVYEEDDHLSKVPVAIRELYSDLKDKIMEFGDLNIEPKKKYIAFKYNTDNICDVEFFKSLIKVFINIKSGIINDPLKKVRDVSNIGHHGNGDYSFDLISRDDLDYLVSLIKQSYNLHK